ncbi:bestrophin family protein [Sediminitomix flava]|uniref:Putative membrane protein n=1 Tax=Sediminitomix flava TaxID=379075 RepID=A0A316A456_SEDFL|nr:bestrophin family protein [Sediminitomix flava]PWJ44517.1 putative membrane protein [Sediminitomix flava]
MNTKNRPSFLDSTIFTILRFKGYLIRRLLSSLIAVIIPTALLCLIYELGFLNLEFTSFTLPGLMGAALGLLLVFRTNTAYDRWWEARKNLGGLVNTSRNFAFQVVNLIKNQEERIYLVKLIAAYPFLLKEHLRDRKNLSEVSFLDEQEIKLIDAWAHKPNSAIQLMLRTINKAYTRNEITDFQQLKLIENTDELIDIIGKCERIKNTPIPSAHNYLLKIYIWIYAMVIPFGFISSLGWWTILAVTSIYYVAMSLVTIAEEIEEPFGEDPNDLPVDKIAQNICKNVFEIMEGETTPELV